MEKIGSEVERVLQEPQLVRRSRSDVTVRLFYEFYAQTRMGSKWLCVVVKYVEKRCIYCHGLFDGQTQSRRRFMAKKVKVWFDAEADYLEVRFSDAAGYQKETHHDAVMERVDDKGNIIGFSILGVSRFKKDKPLEADLISA